MSEETNSAWDSVESVETNMIKFDNVGQVVVGLLLSVKDTPTKFGNSNLYRIKTAEGDSSFFASAILDDKVIGQIGKIVRIEFIESKPSTKGNDMKIFDVKAMPDNEENRVKVGLSTDW